MHDTLLPSLRSDYKAAETYVEPAGRARLPLPVCTLNGRSDPEVTFDESARPHGSGIPHIHYARTGSTAVTST